MTEFMLGLLVLAMAVIASVLIDIKDALQKIPGMLDDIRTTIRDKRS